MRSKELVDIDFEISVTSTSSETDIIAEVSKNVDIYDKEKSDDEEQSTDCTVFQS